MRKGTDDKPVLVFCSLITFRKASYLGRDTDKKPVFLRCCLAVSPQFKHLILLLTCFIRLIRKGADKKLVLPHCCLEITPLPVTDVVSIGQSQ